MNYTPHYYRAHPTSMPVLCEISGEGMVYMLEDGTAKPKSAYGGTFTKLVEETATILAFYARVCERAERNMELTGTVSGAHWNAMRQELAARGIEEGK